MTLALLLTAVGGAWAQEETLLTTITPTGTGSYSETTTGVVTVKLSNVSRYSGDYGWLSSRSGSVTVEAKEGYTITKCVFKQNDKNPVTITTSPFAITFDDEWGRCVQNDDMDGVTSIEVYGYAPEPAIKVTTNAAEEGATFTEASFEMPTYDVNFSYELVRDMAVSMTTKIGDGKDGYRIRLQKNEQTGKYEPAEMTVQQMMALVKVHDAIENYDLTFGVLDANCIVNIYAANENNEATGNAIAFQDLTPGRYIAKAVAASNSNYSGETGMSNIFELYQGYQVVIPAGEYVTYYKDEAVRLEEKDKNDIELCTITAVEDGKAVLSDNFNAMKANTPFLLKNTTSEEKTILLIPCNEPNLAVTVAKEFKGTEGPCVFSEELMATGDFYVCNGKEFIKVRGAGTLAANKAYLFVEGNNTPASIPFRRSIGGEGEGTTSIDNLNVNDNLNDNEATWYDLNGRKLNGKPAQKGIYIKNGKKIVVK